MIKLKEEISNPKNAHRKVFLSAGEAVLGFNGDVLFTSRIGHTGAMTLWDPRTRIGGMAHLVLPTYPGVSTRQWFQSGVSPEIAFPFLLSEMKKKGALLRNTQLRLIGGDHLMNENAIQIADALGITILPGFQENSWRRLSFNIRSGVVSIQFDSGTSFTI